MVLFNHDPLRSRCGLFLTVGVTSIHAFSSRSSLPPDENSDEEQRGHEYTIVGGMKVVDYNKAEEAHEEILSAGAGITSRRSGVEHQDEQENRMENIIGGGGNAGVGAVGALVGDDEEKAVYGDGQFDNSFLDIDGNPINDVIDDGVIDGRLGAFDKEMFNSGSSDHRGSSNGGDESVKLETDDVNIGVVKHEQVSSTVSSPISSRGLKKTFPTFTDVPRGTTSGPIPPLDQANKNLRQPPEQVASSSLLEKSPAPVVPEEPTDDEVKILLDGTRTPSTTTTLEQEELRTPSSEDYSFSTTNKAQDEEQQRQQSEEFSTTSHMNLYEPKTATTLPPEFFKTPESLSSDDEDGTEPSSSIIETTLLPESTFSESLSSDDEDGTEASSSPSIIETASLKDRGKRVLVAAKEKVSKVKEQ